MKLLITIISVLIFWTALKFVFAVFKRLGSKNTINDVLDRAEEKIGNAATNTANYIKNKKKKKEEEKPIVTIH